MLRKWKKLKLQYNLPRGHPYVSQIRLAAAHAASTAVTAADNAYTLAGGTAVYDTSVLGRCLRDAHVVTQHIQTAPKVNEPLGRALLGLDVDSSMF